MTWTWTWKTVLSAALLLSVPSIATARTWTLLDSGGVGICVDGAENCDAYNTSISLTSIEEYDVFVSSTTYYFTVNSSDTALRLTDTWTEGECGQDAICTIRSQEAVIPNGGIAYSPPAVNTEPELRYTVYHIESGAVSNLIGGVNAELPTAITTGDMMFEFEFENLLRDSAYDYVMLTFRIKTFDNKVSSDSVFSYYPTGNIMRLALASGVIMDLPTLSNNSGDSVITYVSYTTADMEFVDVTIKIPPSSSYGSYVKYSFAMRFSGIAEDRLIVPASTLNFYSGGFEFCSAANCNVQSGVLSMTLDRLVMSPSLYSTLEYDSLVTDFAAASSLPFSDSFGYGDYANTFPLILQISSSGDVEAYQNTSALLNGDLQTDDYTYITLSVTRLANEESIYVMGETLTAPAGALHVRLSGTIEPNSTLTLGEFGISFFLSVMRQGKIVTSFETESIGEYIRLLNVSGLHLLYPTLGYADQMESGVSIEAVAHDSGDYKGLIQLLIRLSAETDFFYEFFISSNNIEYQYVNSSSPGVISTTYPGNTNSPNVSSTDGKPILTKMLTLPRGEFGLCFDRHCSTSAVKVGFTGLASTEGTRLGRFANASAFVFSEPKRTISPNGDEIWSTSFKALVPQNRFLPPMPYKASLAASYPTFAVRVDQYLTNGVTMNADRELWVPRGALKFSFGIFNWKFMSPMDFIVLNVTLSSIIGDVPGASGLNTTVKDDLLRIWFGDDKFLDIPLLANVDGGNGNIFITPVVEPDIGIVLMMHFSYFEDRLVYDPVLASQELVTQDFRNLVNMRTSVKQPLSDEVAIALTAIFGLLIIAGAVRCLQKFPIKLDFHEIFF